MKTFKPLLAVTLTMFLSLLVFSTVASPARADPTVETFIYSWSNSDSEGKTPEPVVTNFQLDDKTILPLMDYTGYTIDPVNSFVKFPGDDTQSYADIFSSLNVDSVNGFLALNNQNPSIVTEDELGLTTTFNSVLIPNDETVTIKYVSTDGKTLDTKTVATKFSRTITIDQPIFEGYTVVANQPTSYVVSKDGVGANVVTVNYDPVSSSSSSGSGSSSSSSGSSSSSSSNSGSSSSTSSTPGSNGSSSSSSMSSTTNADQSSVNSNTQSSTVSNATSSSQSTTTVAPAQSNSSSSNSGTGTLAAKHAELPSTGQTVKRSAGFAEMLMLLGVTLLSGIGYFRFKKRTHYKH
ncbi:hypothetical protein ACRYI5_01755 [Furfurilactobacillus sp. WILCCON 0119]